VAGYKLPFLTIPSQSNFPKNSNFSMKEQNEINCCINRLLGIGAQISTSYFYKASKLKEDVNDCIR